ncbi:MAG: hypothetical protein ACYDEC_17210, partial [Bacteroidia bacterium]
MKQSIKTHLTLNPSPKERDFKHSPLLTFSPLSLWRGAGGEVKALAMTLLLLFLPFLWKGSGIGAQNVGINSTGATPDPSSLLDINAAPSNNKGLLIPRISLASTTDVTTIPTPATSLVVYNTNATMTGGSGVGYY